MFGNIFDQDILNPFGALQSIIDTISAPFIILEILLVALMYITACYTVMLIGRKTGETDDWMAYVPIANDIYRLRFVNAPKWHVFFFGFTGTLCIAAVELLLITAFKSTFSIAFLIFGIIILLGYIVMSVYVTFKYLTRYYRGFGFQHMLALVYFTPFVAIFTIGFDLYFAFSNFIVYNKQAAVSVQNGVSAPNDNGLNYSVFPAIGQISALNGMYKDAVFQIHDMEEITFGRENPDCQIVFDQFNTDVSRKHCAVRFNAKDGRYIVTDYSKNGTFTSEDHRLQPGVPVALASGTIICLGSRMNMFRLG